PGDAVVLLLRVERCADVAEHPELDGAARLKLAGRARRRGSGRTGPALLIAATCRGNEGERGDQRQYAEISLHVTPLSSSISSRVPPGPCPGTASMPQARPSLHLPSGKLPPV